MPTLAEALGAMAAARPDAPAIIHHQRGLRFSYRDLWETVRRTASGLLALGVEPGLPVALWGGNQPEWLAAQYALSFLGALWVPLDPKAGDQAVAHVLEHSGALTIMADADMVNRMRGLEGRTDRRTALERIISLTPGETPSGAIPWDRVQEAGREEPSMGGAPRVWGLQTAAIIYTAGTTGEPKGVMVSHQGLLAKALAAGQRLGLSPDDRLALLHPLFHLLGHTGTALMGLARGSALVIPSAHFDPDPALAALEKERCTGLFGTPEMLHALLGRPGWEKRDLSALRTGIVSGAPCSLELMGRLARDMGVRDMAVGYGLTEASSWIALTHPEDSLETRVTTVGTPLSGAEVRVLDPVTGRPLPPGEVGEIVTRGYLMLGYHRMPQATKASLDSEGWLYTGDLGHYGRAGYLTITGRASDTLYHKGRVVHPAQVEEALYALPSLAEAQVFGVPRADGSHLVLAWVRLRPGSRLGVGELARYCRKVLPAHQVPDGFKIVESFPTTRSGKVKKYRLRQMALEDLGTKN